MLNVLTGDDLFAYIMMQRQVDPRLVVVVEGPEDCGIMDPHLRDSVVQSVPGYGKESVTRVAELITNDPRIVCLVDRDFDPEPVVGEDPPGLVRTAYHDLLAEVIMACPDVLARIVANHAPREQVRRQSLNLAEVLVEFGAAIGAARFRSILDGLGFRMAKFPVNNAVRRVYNDGVTVEEAVAEAIVARSSSSIGVEELAGMIRLQVRSWISPALHCSGHDLVAALAAILREVWRGASSQDSIARAVRSGIDCACIQTTATFARIHEWGVLCGAQVWTCPNTAA